MASSRRQQPGLTATGEQRIFVKHNYIDHADTEDVFGGKYSDTLSKNYELLHYNTAEKEVKRTKPSPCFPLKLHMLLNEMIRRGQDDVISWRPHGRAFYIRNNDFFVRKILPKYFKKCKASSFFRQLNLYGFERITTGFDTGAYYNEYFLRGKLFLARNIVRTKVKGTKIRAASSPQDEPDFYSMSPLPESSVNRQKTLEEQPLEDPTIASLENRIGKRTSAYARPQRLVSSPRRINTDYSQLQSSQRLSDIPLPMQSTLPQQMNTNFSRLQPSWRLSDAPSPMQSSIPIHNTRNSIAIMENYHNPVDAMPDSYSFIRTMCDNPISTDAIHSNSMNILSDPFSYPNHLPPTEPASAVSSFRPDHNHLFPIMHIPSASTLYSYDDAFLHNNPSPSTHTLHHYQDMGHSAHTTMFGRRDPDIAHNSRLMTLPPPRDTSQIVRVVRALEMYQSHPPRNNFPSNLIGHRLLLSSSDRPRSLSDIINSYLENQTSQP